MVSLRNLSIRKKVFIIVILAVLFSIAGFLGSSINLLKIKASASSIYNIRLKSVDYLIEADRDAYQSSVAVAHSLKAHIYEKNAKLLKELKSAKENLAQVKQRFDKFHAIFKKDVRKNSAEFKIFYENYAKWEKTSIKVFELISNKSIAEASNIYFSDYSKYFDLMRDSMDKLTEKSLALAKSEYNLSQKAIKNSFISSIALNIALIIVLIVVSIFITNAISKPLKKIVLSSKQISEGDLNIEVSEKLAHSKDEAGQLYCSFMHMMVYLKEREKLINLIAQGSGDFTVDVELASDADSFGKSIAQMLLSLNRILGDVNIASTEISANANEVSKSSSDLSSGASKQAASLEQMAASLLEISSQAKKNSGHSENAKTVSDQTASKAKRGYDQIKSLVASMQEMMDSSHEIKKIIKVIDDIAFQTNLLALNANVEAARAGKFGKGFAVVAEEVRNLAQKSARSVKETTEIIENSLKNIEKGNHFVEKTAKDLDDILNGIIKLADITSEIAVASNEQSQGLTEINIALSQISEVTQSNSAAAEEGASAAQELSNQAFKLKEIVSTFKLKELKDEHDDNLEDLNLKDINPQILEFLKEKLNLKE